MTPRPAPDELAESRRKAQWFIATVPNHSMAETLRVMLRATAPITKEEAIPVMIEHANKNGVWSPSDTDTEQAQEALDGRSHGTWESSILAQYQTLVHFFGGAE